jgi:hypothetical protein
MSYTPSTTPQRARVITPVTPQRSTDAVIEPTLLYAFAPLHKRAFGMATGAAAATLMLAISIARVTLPTAHQFPLVLLREYFAGFDLTPLGIAIGVAWAFAVGFVGGWFGAFCRNLALAISAFVIRTRAELVETREFLDHI